MKLHFLGTGGGRVTTALQLRRTAGFRLELGKTVIHVDPGPGTTIAYKQFKIPLNFSFIFVSHPHIDHYAEAPILGEYLAGFGRKKLENKIYVHKSLEEIFQDYHKKILNPVYLDVNEEFRINDVKVKCTKMIHTSSGCGFYFEYKNKKIWYVSDGKIAEENLSLDPDVVIINTTFPKFINSKYHANITDAINYAKEKEPDLVIITHFGKRLLDYNPVKAAREAEKESGVKFIAANDNLIIDLDTYLEDGLNKFIG